MNTHKLKGPHERAATVRSETNAALSTQEKRIVSALYPIAVSAFVGHQTRDGFWTDGIKTALTRLAEEQGLLCCHSGTTGEWLCDVCWVETTAGPTTPRAWQSARRLKLACESEWSEDEEDIVWDFMKLSWVQADLRLYIYTNHMKSSAAQHPVALCRDRCPASKNSRYLLIGFPKLVERGETFRVDAWTM